MNEIEPVSERVIKIEQVKQEQVEYLGDLTWNYIDQGEASTLKFEPKEEDEEVDLKPPVRLFLDSKAVSEDTGMQEEDPLGMCNENVHFKRECFDGGECGAAGTFGDSKCGEGSVGEKGHGAGNRSFCGERNVPALADAGGNPNHAAVRQKHSAENVTRPVRPNTSRHVGEQSSRVKSMSKSRCEVSIMPKEKSCNECSLCQKSFKQNVSLNRHMREIHSIERRHECSICQKVFKRRRYLVAHMQIHGDGRPHECSVCRKTFALKSYLVLHMRVHSCDHPLECSVCQRAFKWRGKLIEHMRIHSGERPYECSICRKGFTQKCTLVSHTRIHSGERPLECSVCQKGFRDRSNLITHIRIHNGVRPHKCSVCQKTFVQKIHLVNHMRIHRREQSH